MNDLLTICTNFPPTLIAVKQHSLYYISYQQSCLNQTLSTTHNSHPYITLLTLSPSMKSTLSPRLSQKSRNNDCISIQLIHKSSLFGVWNQWTNNCKLSLYCHRAWTKFGNWLAWLLLSTTQLVILFLKSPK